MTNGTIRIRLLLFAAYREAVGRSECEIDLPTGSTLADLFASLTETHPELAAYRPYTTFARNREVVPPEATLHDGDEVAFLQPASGG